MEEHERADLAGIRRKFGVPAEQGRRVVFDGQPGVIVGARFGHIRVQLDGEHEAEDIHPTWNVTYGEMGE